MKKKILPVIKKISKSLTAFLGVFIVLVCSFASPIAASNVASDSSSPLFYSYWNLTKIIVTYNDGVTAVFDLPTTFYESNSYYTNDIVIDSLNSDKTLSLSCYVGNTLLKRASASYSFNAIDFSNISFIFENSVIRYYPTNFGSSGSMPSGYNRNETVPIIQFQNSTNVVKSFSGYAEYVHPVYGSSEDDFTFKFETLNSQFGLVASDPFVNNGFIDTDIGSISVYDLVPYSLYSSEVQYYKNNISVQDALQVPYFPLVKVDMQLDFTNVTSDTYKIAVALPLGISYNNYSFNPVSEWYERYFAGYKQYGDSTNVDFTSWISTAVGGFLAFEFIPGISFGLLLTFIIGIACVNFFLKFFAGG